MDKVRLIVQVAFYVMTAVIIGLGTVLFVLSLLRGGIYHTFDRIVLGCGLAGALVAVVLLFVRMRGRR